MSFDDIPAVKHLEEKQGPWRSWKIGALGPPSPPLVPSDSCPNCKGQGRFRSKAKLGEEGFGRAVDCPACLGWGKREDYLAATRAYAGIPQRLWNECSFETFDLLRHGGSHAGHIAAYQWANSPSTPSILTLNGEFGTGKSHLAIAACRDLIERGIHRVRFYSVARLLDDLRATQARYGRHVVGGDDSPPPSLQTARYRLETEPVLVLDDWGLDRWTEFAEEQLTLLIDHRWQNADVTRTLITTNNDPATFPGRIASRITDATHAWTVACEGPDQRRVEKE